MTPLSHSAQYLAISEIDNMPNKLTDKPFDRTTCCALSFLHSVLKDSTPLLVIVRCTHTINVHDVTLQHTPKLHWNEASHYMSARSTRTRGSVLISMSMMSHTMTKYSSFVYEIESAIIVIVATMYNVHVATPGCIQPVWKLNCITDVLRFSRLQITQTVKPNNIH